MRWPLQPLQPFQQTQLQPPFGQSVASLCHPWFTTTNFSYRFPIFETSATALCGTTGIFGVSFHWLYCICLHVFVPCSIEGLPLIVGCSHVPRECVAGPAFSLLLFLCFMAVAGPAKMWELQVISEVWYGLVSIGRVLLRSCSLIVLFWNLGICFTFFHNVTPVCSP